MNMKRRVKMRRGFMCQSPGSAAGCTAGDPLSVIVPRRPDRTLVDRANSLALNNSTSAKYARGFMCQSPGSAAGCTTGDPLSVIVPRRPDRTLVDRANSLALANSTSAKYARGFMCQSPGSAAGCTTGDPLSVIVPRRPDRTLVDRANSLALDNSTSAKYARLVESTPQRLGNNAAAKMKSTDSVPMPPVVKRRPGGDHKNTGVVGDRKDLQKPAPAVASTADQVFQVSYCLRTLEYWGDIVQHRFGEQEGDSDGTRVTSGSAGEHIEGEKSRVLALLS
ncbi:hypothetical protein RHGRI_032316 [Rhododendron griersonianum]|uniref:Uncharacterized protein n=1 Tax=Rhododendron griersonianum TaxID=479676 RepID=A0AAV6IC32_9ERIC|nr:hypothetical protein RHGRI_032316 [Rhododendron griersonianum]